MVRFILLHRALDTSLFPIYLKRATTDLSSLLPSSSNRILNQIDSFILKQSNRVFVIPQPPSHSKVLQEQHGLIDRIHLLLEACELNSVSEEDYIDLGKAGLGSCLLGGCQIVRFINFERTRLPSEILRHNIEEKKRYLVDIHLEAEGVYNQRLQNLALTINKVKYVMRCAFSDLKKAPPILERLIPEAAASYIWKGDGSFVEELIECMTPHTEDVALRELKAKIHSHDPSCSNDTEMKIRKSLLW
ncbi:hypothetical protein OROHE_008001 [Orobanche hederae]